MVRAAWCTSRRAPPSRLKPWRDPTRNQNLRLYERGHDPAARIGRITLEEERLKAPSIRNVQNEPFLVAIGDKCEKFSLFTPNGSSPPGTKSYEKYPVLCIRGFPIIRGDYSRWCICVGRS